MYVMRRNRASALLLCAILSTISVFAQNTSSKVQAQKVLGQARAALGSEAAVKNLNSFSALFQVRSLVRTGGQRLGEIQVDFLLPDKFVKNETQNLPANLGQVISHAVLNAEQAEFNVRTTTPEVPVLPASKTDPAKEQAALLQRLRKEYTLYLLQLLQSPSSPLPIEYTYVGEAQADDGRADVLEAKGPGGFMARLFFDKETHRLLLLSYQEPAPQQLFLGAGGKPVQTAGSKGEEPTIEVQVRFSEYRSEDGILLPHLIIRERGGTVDQEMTLKDFKVNPSFKPKHFDVKLGR
jgi:hypothetical protein